LLCFFFQVHFDSPSVAERFFHLRGGAEEGILLAVGFDSPNSVPIRSSEADMQKRTQIISAAVCVGVVALAGLGYLSHHKGLFRKPGAVSVTMTTSGDVSVPDVAKMSIKSSAFEDGGTFPAVSTCDGPEKSPPLSWSNVPKGTDSLAIFVEDPDMPDPAIHSMTWSSWVVYNLSPDVTSLPESVDPLPKDALSATNTWGRIGYGGPCPSIGTHRIFTRIYALDKKLDIEGTPKREDVLAAMQGHIIGEGELMATYARPMPKPPEPAAESEKNGKKR